ncbi:hypothetical protein L207DRAFT_547606 [Hyaloscypha variabilis F]|uniref:Ubiquitin 3 binding protein But2 C-terminal domain-containing protein n=1 Tax=Hyaloscypha variabilis (strain UAMH 11265 / GT02V1 / F) TaxID=1149755 RepID=A0A2J6R7F9_HYAVF|nr:hypothetical protein L207DRAFT_547606 [Hyaloscypha variabilis F]
MTTLTLIFFLFLGSITANPIALPHRYHKSHGQECPENGTLDHTNHFSVQNMVPVSASQPTVALGSSITALITPNDYCTIFNLVVPPSGLNKTCNLELLIPDREQAGFNYMFAGPGHFTFTGYAFGPPSLLTTGNAYVINVGPCGIQPGMEGMEVIGLLCSNDTTFVYQQSERKCPIGFFVTIT